MKCNCNYDETISSKEILRLILEEKITIWDLSIKLNVNLSGANSLKDMLLKCCNNDTEKTNRYLDLIKKNNTKYIETNTFETMCFKTLLSLAKSGYTHIELMKKFGIVGYTTFSYHLKKVYKDEKISNTLKETLKNKIRENRNSKRVKIIYEENVELKQDIDVTEEVPTTELTSLPIEVVNTNENFNSDKIIIYSYEYLKFVNLDKEFLDYNDEKIIPSLSFELFMKDNQIMDNKKAMLSSAINNPKINLRILSTSSWYDYKKIQNKSPYISCDNDILISQALMLSKYTNKDIYIAALENLTVLNVLTLGFGVRASKQMLIEGFFNFNSKEDTLSYFNYKLPKENSINILEDSKVYILDTCFVIGDNNKDNCHYKNKVRESVFKNKKDLKLICRSVLAELKSRQHFFSTIYAAKCNPTIKLILNMNLNYNYEDVAILNYAMYYQNKIGSNIFLLTHDYTMFMEALQYNLSTIYLQEDFENIIKEPPMENDEGNKIAIESFDEGSYEESEDENFDELISKPLYKTIVFTDYGKNHILINSNDLDKVIDHNGMVMRKINGHNSFKFYTVEIGDFIMFKDSSIYKINSFEGDDNLTFVKQKDYWKKYDKSNK